MPLFYTNLNEAVLFTQMFLILSKIDERSCSNLIRFVPKNKCPIMGVGRGATIFVGRWGFFGRGRFLKRQQ